MDETRHSHDLDGDGRRGPAAPTGRLPAATFWLLELDGSRLTETQFLHVFDDESLEWAPDRTRALRFRTAEAARAFAEAEWVTGWVAAEHFAADLVGEEVETDVDDEDLAVA